MLRLLSLQKIFSSWIVLWLRIHHHPFNMDRRRRTRIAKKVRTAWIELNHHPWNFTQSNLKIQIRQRVFDFLLSIPSWLLNLRLKTWSPRYFFVCTYHLPSNWFLVVFHTNCEVTWSPSFSSGFPVPLWYVLVRAIRCVSAEIYQRQTMYTWGSRCVLLDSLHSRSWKNPYEQRIVGYQGIVHLSQLQNPLLTSCKTFSIDRRRQSWNGIILKVINMDIDSGSLRISQPVFWAQFRLVRNRLHFLSKSTRIFFDTCERANRRLNRQRNHPMPDLSSLVFTKMKRREYELYRWNVPSWSIVPYRDLTKEVDWESQWDQQGMSFCLGEFIGLRRALVLFEWKERLLGWETKRWRMRQISNSAQTKKKWFRKIDHGYLWSRNNNIRHSASQSKVRWVIRDSSILFIRRQSHNEVKINGEFPSAVMEMGPV